MRLRLIRLQVPNRKRLKLRPFLALFCKNAYALRPSQRETWRNILVVALALQTLQ